MRPVKTKELYPEVASATGHTEDEIRAVAEYFFQQVRESLSNLTDVRIHLSNLGDFTVKHWLIDKEIERCNKIIKHRASLSVPLKNRIDKLLSVRKIHQEETQRKDFIYNHKKLSHENKSRKSS